MTAGSSNPATHGTQKVGPTSAPPTYTVTSDGLRLAWWCAGPTDPATPGVLMIMGFGARGSAFRHQVEHADSVAGARHAAWFDHRGVGHSDAPRKALTMHRLASDAVEVADAAGIKRFHVVGVSMGGMVAQHVALHWLPRTVSLTLIATHPGGPLARIPPLGAFRFGPRTASRDLKKRFSALSRLLYPPAYLEGIDQNELHEALRHEFGDGTALSTMWRQFAAIWRHDTRSDLPKLAGLPTLVVQSGPDNLVRPHWSTYLAKHIPGAKLARFPHAGHGVVRQCADEINPLLNRHFADAERERPR